jgi:RimJ/RimL family protein N-acetyltransferase
VYEVGWSVVPAAQGRGLASAATALLLEHMRSVGEHQFVHAFPSTENPPSNGICRKLGFTLLEVCRFEYPPASGNWMFCNDWQLDLALPSPRDGEASRSA